jgi:hypothetical protein
MFIEEVYVRFPGISLSDQTGLLTVLSHSVAVEDNP